MTFRRDERQAARRELDLRERIADEIARNGPIPFSRYMELCLYEPELGYYSRAREQFGKAGDFYTSSDVDAVFGRLLARQFEEMWRSLDSPARIDLIELGPGRGLFARDVLDWSAKQFPEFSLALRYSLVEQSANLRTKLLDRLQEHIAGGKCEIFDSLESSASAASNNVIVFGNEFFDALPVEILSSAGKLHIALENNRLHETWLPPLAEELEFLDRYGVHPEADERIEVPILAQHWMRQIARSIERGLLAIIDYGYTRHQQLAGRYRGTLMAYRRHYASPDPYQAPGEQDLTAHVNFTALAAACEQAGMQCEKLLTQSQFLMGIGETTQFADAFEDCRIPQERAKVALQLKHLVTPAGMGETFQVLTASRGVDAKKIAALSGLSFGKSSQFSLKDVDCAALERYT